MYIVLLTSLLVASSTLLTSGARTATDCATNLDCTILDLQEMSLVERQRMVSEMQSIHGPSLGASDRWTNVLGVMDFFIANNLGNEPFTWFSMVDCAILEGIERGVALALEPTHPSAHLGDFDNPSARLWRSYASRIREWNLDVPSDRGEHDRAWATAEFFGTEYGRYTAELKYGILITSPELHWTAFTQLYRLLMVSHSGLPVEVSIILDRIFGGEHKGFLDWVTDVRLREPSRTGLQAAWDLANRNLFATITESVKVLEAYLPYLIAGYKESTGSSATTSQRSRAEL